MPDDNFKEEPRAVNYGKRFTIKEGEPINYADGDLEFVEDDTIPGLYSADIRRWFQTSESPVPASNGHKK